MAVRIPCRLFAPLLQRGSQGSTFTAPEAANPISRICAVYLLVLSCRCPARPRSFRVYSGSWSVQPADRPLRPWTTALWFLPWILLGDRPHLAGDGPRPPGQAPA